jgi:tRNA (guanine-N7-)-methyltransferase
MTAHKPGDPLTLNRLYGRASGHKLRKGQQELVDKLLPQIEVPAEGEVTAVGLFGEDRPLHFEIGFGSGEHLADRADMLPDHGFIGAEPFLNGVAAALAHVRDKHLAKRRMVNDRPVDLFAAKLKPGGELRIATDDPTYLTWALTVMQRHRDQFEWLAERPKDFLEPSGGWIETRYGAKSRREGRRPYYLRYRRT